MALVTYNQLANDGKVYALIDTVNVVFEKCRLTDIFRWLKLNDQIEEFLSSGFNSSRGFVDLAVFQHNGIRFEIFNGINPFLVKDDYDVSSIIFPKIRVDISGTGHDFLRSRGIDFSSYRYVAPVLPEGASYHFTRLDFAFDFVNYKPEFMDELITHIQNNHLPNGRIPLCAYEGRRGSAVSASLKLVSQRTVYLGSGQSDRLLRVYDKRMECSDLRTGTYILTNPYGDPDSWYRIELQCRRNVADGLSCPCSDPSVNSFEAVLKDIFDRYCFADPDFDPRLGNRPPVEFWYRLFDWSDITARLIIPNEKRVESYDSDRSYVEDFARRSVRQFMLVYSLIGADGILELCRNYLNSCYIPGDSLSRRRLNSLISKIASCSLVDTVSHSSSGICLNSGRFTFNY